MKKSILALAAIAFAAPVLAGPGAGGNAGAGLSVGIGAGGVHAGANANANANAGTRGPSASAIENSNGQFSTDRDFGRARAEERMSAQGLAHSQASNDADKKRHRKPLGTRLGAEGSSTTDVIVNRR